MSAAVEAFLVRAGWAEAARQPLAGDASSRRYLRLVRGRESVVLMQAPTDPALDAFVEIGRRLAALGLSVPRLLAEDREAGLLLLEDFGDAVFSDLLAAGADQAPLYALAVDALIHLHRRFDPADAAGLPVFDAVRFENQAMLFAETALPRALAGEELVDASAALRRTWAALLPAAGAVPGSLLLRDYHAGNLIRLDGRPGVAACGLLDYQDAGLGPVVYDLVSLLEDARLELPDGLREAMRARYLEAFSGLDRDAFARAWTVLALQRHLRVIAVFHRLAEAEGKRRYLVHLPRLWRLVQGHLEVPVAAPLRAWAERWLPPPSRRRLGAEAA